MLLAAHSTLPAHSVFAESLVTMRAPPTQSQTQRLQLGAFPPPPPPAPPLRRNLSLVPPQERLIVSQLAYLASQHHTSEYNRLKFGPRGSPVTYVPLTLEEPEHVKQLQTRQAIHTRQKAWWPSNREVISPSPQHGVPSSVSLPALSTSTVVATEGQAVAHTLPAIVTSPSTNIQQEISAAISSPLPSFMSVPTIHTMKTSQTHPINISMVVPFEHLPTITSKLTPAPKSSPYMFCLPQNLFLDRVTAVYLPGAHTFTAVPLPNFIPHLNADSPRGHLGPLGMVWSQPSSDERPYTPPNTPHHSPPLRGRKTPFPPPPPFLVPSQATPRRLMTESPPVPANMHVPIPAELPPPNPYMLNPFSMLPPPNRPSGPIRRPKHERALSAPATLQLLKGVQRKGKGKPLPRNRSYPVVGPSPLSTSPVIVPASVMESDPAAEAPPDAASNSDSASSQEDAMEITAALSDSLTENPAFLKKPDEDTQVPPPLGPIAAVGKSSDLHPPVNSEGSADVLRLGNLYLSSCPGKKVRLSGPVKGRGAICRDLRADLIRVKELGVGCIICCLDDSELDFLGASWSEYSRIADELGLDVLRLPMPEGLAPLSPEALDAHLERLIAAYTLRGVPILAHCRGGVGRAGLVACCWLLKLGLCGWKDAESPTARASTTATPLMSTSAWSTQPTQPSETSASAPVPPQWTGLPQFAFAALHPPTALASEAGPGSGACPATVRLVERVIAVVRRRRSLKAVETFEQVRFLVDFVEHLDAKARVGRDVE